MKAMPRVALGIVAVAALSSCATGNEATDGVSDTSTRTITVAAASDLRPVFDELGALFTEETGTSVTLVYGSSGLLREQIINGAPYDVYASANSAFVDEVLEAGRGQRESRRAFALGRLALWTNDSDTTPAVFDDIALPIYRRVTIANPDHAPYGVAARDALENRGLWDAIENRLVLADNIGDAFRIVQSGNADIGVIALSLVITLDTEYFVIPSELHRPLDQTLVVLTSGPRGEAGQEFVEFVTSEVGRQLLTKYGFELPARAGESSIDNDTTTSNPTE